MCKCYTDSMYPDGYTPPILTADAVVFQLVDSVLSVLLIKRANEPFKGKWALPGGYNAAGETTQEAMSRILAAKAGITAKDLKLVEQLYTFDTVARDPRGHAVSVTYMGIGKDLTPKTSDATQHPSFFPLDELPPLAYDHADIITYAQTRLRSKVMYTNAIFAMLDPLFTLTQLQSAYEAVLGRKLDKRNFRKKFLSLDLIVETDQQHREGAHRPARLYRFRKNTLQTLERSFD
jgi:8-oxo-dGTP diphosphatase